MRRKPVSMALVAALACQLTAAAPLQAASPYLLPVPAGTTVLVFQGNNSEYDHTAINGSQFAWDFTVGATEFPVAAARGGTVIGARSDSTNTNCRSLACWTDANYVLIDHGDKTSALYLHLKTGSVAVKAGQTVAQGALLGNADSTGYSYGTHLHFMVETTPTSRVGSGWWWTQSVAITFADAGLPLVDQSYTSRNAAQPAVTPASTPIAPPGAPTGVAGSAKLYTDPACTDPEGPDFTGSGYACARISIGWQAAPGAVEGYRIYLDPCAQPSLGGPQPSPCPGLVATLPATARTYGTATSDAAGTTSGTWFVAAFNGAGESRRIKAVDVFEGY